MEKTACAVYVTLNNETDATEVVADQLTGRDEAMFVARAFHAVLTTLDPSFMSYGVWCLSLNVVAFTKGDLLDLKKALGVNHMFLVADEVARAPNTERALSALCRLGDAEPTFPVTVLASCYEPSLAVDMSTESRRSLVAIPTVLAPVVNDLPAVRNHDLLCRYCRPLHAVRGASRAGCKWKEDENGRKQGDCQRQKDRGGACESAVQRRR